MAGAFRLDPWPFCRIPGEGSVIRAAPVTCRSCRAGDHPAGGDYFRPWEGFCSSCSGISTVWTREEPDLPEVATIWDLPIS